MRNNCYALTEANNPSAKMSGLFGAIALHYLQLQSLKVAYS